MQAGAYMAMTSLPGRPDYSSNVPRDTQRGILAFRAMRTTNLAQSVKLATARTMSNGQSGSADFKISCCVVLAQNGCRPSPLWVMHIGCGCAPPAPPSFTVKCFEILKGAM
ncbi:hypothetical protein AAFF_G00305860 [Aldrovandia affinis]|uniref:Uncharacterized protein n=1 Tax=Aldrovandia affinis TaxID=143900 RepID=A0AAD7SPG9_9TELE|nr:hypothetical protein AAFF_G00305860 [Aldrovandia affinis]